MKKLLANIKNYYLLIILLFIVVLLVFAYTYNNYFNPPINDTELYITSQVELKSKELDEHNQVIINPNENKIITATVKNNFNTDKKYHIWYKNLKDNTNIELTIQSSSDIILSEVDNIIEKNSHHQITVVIKNNSDIETKIEFGIVYGNTKDQLKLPDESTLVAQTIKSNKLKEYSIGDKIVLNDHSRWHVIQESSTNDDYIVLLNDNIINIEDNNQSLDVVNNKVLFEPNDENIKFYLENTYKKSLEKNNITFGELGEIRLINLNELLSIGNYNHKDYTYYKNSSPSWLNMDTPWWTMTPFSTNSTYYVYKGNIYYAQDKNTTRAAIRPVIKVLKSNINS